MVKVGSRKVITDERLDRAIAQTVEYFRRRFLPENHALDWSSLDSTPRAVVTAGADGAAQGQGGYWLGELEADSTLESDYILFLSFLDPSAHREKIRKLAATVRGEQLEDGSWNIYRGGPGEVSASVKAYFALKLAGHSPDEPFMVKARDAILRMGGAEKVNTFTKIYLTFLNQFDWDEVPAIPPEIVLLPRFFYFNIYEVSYWSRAILIPLSVLYAKKPNRHIDTQVSLEEIFLRRDGGKRANGVNGDGREAPAHGNGSPEGGRKTGGGEKDEAAGEAAGDANGAEAGFSRRLAIPKDPNLLSWRSFFLLMDRLLKLIEKTPVKPLRSLALKKAEEWMVSRTEASDGLGAIFPAMVNSVMALRSLGYDDTHPSIKRTLEKLRELEIEDGGTLRLQPCLSPVWDTALALNALFEAGLPAAAPEALRAARWLLTKEARRSGDWKLRVPDAEVSGWYFQFRNEFYPDIDDTAAVILALERADWEQVEGLEAAIGRGLDWILSMQCSNGGWAAFDADIDREALTHVPYADHNAMLDPACADITGRVLEALGRFPALHEGPRMREAVQRGVEFLKSAQEPDGSWYGRWGVNYVYGTCHAVKGLTAVGEDPKSPSISRAATWLKSCQNPDGGWGESCGSYDDPTLKGKGDSTASQTAWAIMGLIAAGEVDSPEVARGVEFLLERQRDDGSWDEDFCTGTGFPSVFYLKYHLYRVYFPLYALSQYRSLVHGLPSPRGPGRVSLPERPRMNGGKAQRLRLFGKTR